MSRRSSRPSRSVPGTSLEDYRALIERRFSNPKIGDTIRRPCLDGSNRQPKFIIPTIADRLEAGASVEGWRWKRRSGAATASYAPRTGRGDRRQELDRSELGPGWCGPRKARATMRGRRR
ncbi:MAG: hypothetical protein R3E51_16210 [Rhizobiaceae bacterium]